MPLKNLVVLALAAMVSLTCYFAAARNRYANLFAEIVELVDREHLQRPGRDELFDDAITGMLSDLDEHSVYLADRDLEMFDENIEQQFGGVGMYVEADPVSGYLMVTVPMPDTPAFRAGLRAHDLITAIDGQSTHGRTRPECIEQMRGKVGASVSLSVRKTTGETSEISLVREIIPVSSVFGDTTNPDGTRNFVLARYPRLGYLRIDQFGVRTVDEFRAALTSVAGSIDGLIIDLRQNSGGPLSAAVDICDMFLDEGKTIVETRGRDRKLVSRHVSQTGTLVPADLPVAVLVNRNSASASEIVAACLQDHGRAVIIGERSYGKGTVQNVYNLQRDRSAVKLTTANYWPPSGRCIDKHDPTAAATGIWGVPPSPGFEIEMTEEEDLALYRQRQAREISGLTGDGEASPADPAVEPPSQRQPAGDDPQDSENAGLQAQANEALPSEDTPQLPLIDRPLERAIQWLREQPAPGTPLAAPVASRAS